MKCNKAFLFFNTILQRFVALCSLCFTIAVYNLKKLALTSLTSGGRSEGIGRLRTEATEFFLIAVYKNMQLRLVFSRLLLVYHYKFRPHWPSSVVQVVMLKESAVLLLFCECLRLIFCFLLCCCHARVRFICNT
jgi:hypothetical protein